MAGTAYWRLQAAQTWALRHQASRLAHLALPPGAVSAAEHAVPI
jgi:hypothetical protein